MACLFLTTVDPDKDFRQGQTHHPYDFPIFWKRAENNKLTLERLDMFFASHPHIVYCLYKLSPHLEHLNYDDFLLGFLYAYINPKKMSPCNSINLGNSDWGYFLNSGIRSLPTTNKLDVFNDVPRRAKRRDGTLKIYCGESNTYNTVQERIQRLSKLSGKALPFSVITNAEFQNYYNGDEICSKVIFLQYDGFEKSNIFNLLGYAYGMLGPKNVRFIMYEPQPVPHIVPSDIIIIDSSCYRMPFEAIETLYKTMVGKPMLGTECNELITEERIHTLTTELDRLNSVISQLQTVKFVEFEQEENQTIKIEINKIDRLLARSKIGAIETKLSNCIKHQASIESQIKSLTENLESVKKDVERTRGCFNEERSLIDNYNSLKASYTDRLQKIETTISTRRHLQSALEEKRRIEQALQKELQKVPLQEELQKVPSKPVPMVIEKQPLPKPVENEKARQEDDEEEKSGRFCVVCMERSKNQLFMPCNHVSCCKECGDALRDKQCPICRVPFTASITIFIV